MRANSPSKGEGCVLLDNYLHYEVRLEEDILCVIM